MTGKYLLLLGALMLGIELGAGQQWGEWTGWTSCTATCGIGTTARTRQCQGQGDDFCSGSVQQTAECRHKNGCQWSEWGSFGSCSTSCGPGVVTKFRECENGTSPISACERDKDASMCQSGDLPTSTQCIHERNMTAPCQVVACPTWNAWGAWTACPVTCGTNGIITRQRTCNGTGTCAGNSTETGPCNPLPQQPCPAEWTQWVPQPCSVTCGQGTRIRTRSCPPPHNCPGLGQDFVACEPQPACGVSTPAPTPVPTPAPGDGTWTTWSTWGSCPQTCARKRPRKTRTRTCQGTGCRGRSQQKRRCPQPQNCRRGGKRGKGGKGGNRRCQGRGCRRAN